MFRNLGPYFVLIVIAIRNCYSISEPDVAKLVFYASRFPYNFTIDRSKITKIILIRVKYCDSLIEVINSSKLAAIVFGLLELITKEWQR